MDDWNLLISLTLMPLMRKLMLNFCHFQTHDLMRVKVTGMGPPITLIVSAPSLSLTTVPDLAPDGLDEGQVWALPTIQLLLECLLVMETNLGYEVKWCWSRWHWMRMTRPSWFNVSFSDGLVHHPPTITQACWLGTELGSFANPTDGTWQCKHGVSCLTQTQSFS